MTAMINLIEFWKKYKIGFAYTKPSDYATKRSINIIPIEERKEIEDRILKTNDIHPELLPSPYCGDIDPSNSDKKVYIVSLNPGVSMLDHYAERGNNKDSKKFFAEMVNNLRQNPTNKKYPNTFINPEFGWHSSSVYWRNRLNEIIGSFAVKNHTWNVDTIFSWLSQRITLLELYPYPSKSSPKFSYKEQCVKLMIDFIIQDLIPLTHNSKKKILVIILRRGDFFKSEILKSMPTFRERDYPNLIIYHNNLAQTALLNTKSEGGAALRKFWNL
jgi:hypothetical protein